MKRLKKKVFLVIFLLLTGFITIIIGAYNIQLYRQSYQAVTRSLQRTVSSGFGLFDNGKRLANDYDTIRFIDGTIYSAILNESDEPLLIINHADNGVPNEAIAQLAYRLIAQQQPKKIGNLYIDRYAYCYQPGVFITIMDNAQTNRFLRQTLFFSFIMYMLLEVLIFLITKRLMRWITKPVAESFERQKRFIADASHELKTPLAVIMASADALQENPQETRWLQYIQSESERMTKLISDLLELAKSEEADSSASFEMADFSKIAAMSCLVFEGLVFEKGITLRSDIEEQIIIHMYPDKIKQLLAILLDNAIQHCAAGGTVTVSLKREKEIALRVSNTGEGIPQGEEEKIFERFYRADEARTRAENRYGLGLSIAKNIALAHGARISAQSTQGVTVFTVLFKR